MKNDAVINGKQITLSDEERKAGEKFHLSRYPFAWVNNQLVFNDNTNDDRDHQHWLCEDYGLTVEEWEKVPRGYMMPGRIQLFIGSQFKPMNTQKLSVTDFQELLTRYWHKYGGQKVVMYNGVKVGKVGEVWEPLIKLGEYYTV